MLSPYTARALSRRFHNHRTPKSARTIRRNTAHIATNKMRLAAIKEELRELAKTEILKSLKAAAMDAPINDEMDDLEAVQTIQGYLIGHQAIPVHKTVCRILIDECGFDTQVISHGEYKGYECGFIPGLPLLKLVGWIHEDAPTLEELFLLESLGDNPTRH